MVPKRFPFAHTRNICQGIKMFLIDRSIPKTRSITDHMHVTRSMICLIYHIAYGEKLQSWTK